MDDASLQDYLGVLRQRWRLILLTTVIGAAAAVGISIVQEPQYHVESELLLGRTASEEIAVDEIGQARSTSDAARELNNEIRLIESRAVRDAVDEEYDGPLDVDAVTASAPASDLSDIITVGMTSPHPAEAARLVNLYADVYLRERREQRIDDVLAASEEIQQRLDDVAERIAELSAPVDDINAQVAAAPAGSSQRTELEDQRQALLLQVLPQLAPLQSREESLRGQLEQLQVTEELSRMGGVEVLEPATEPRQPVSPNTARNVTIGALAGLAAGLVLAFMRDRFDDSVRSNDDVERLTGLPTFGMIPALGDDPPAADLVSLVDRSSPAAEAFRLVRTSVKFLGIDTPVQSVLVTSAAASEGKTVTAANLAIVLAQGGDRVLLVGADLRRPRLHDMFGAPEAPGLTSLLLGDTPAESAIYAVAEVEGLHILPPGPTPPNPAELLDSARARELLTSLAARYDSLVIDSPPVLPVTDAQVLARAADAVLLVVAYRETSRRGLRRSLELLAHVGAPLVGTVLNLVPAKESYGGHPYRYEAYRSRSERRRARSAKVRPTLRPTPAHLTNEANNGGPRAGPVGAVDSHASEADHTQ